MWPILLGYLAGSVPFAFLLARRAGIDVRFAGSGNVGAANVMRTTGTWRAVLVMALDVAKGALAVVLASVVVHAGITLTALAAAAAVVRQGSAGSGARVGGARRRDVDGARRGRCGRRTHLSRLAAIPRW
jgi:glycerol-3-phosphate acyltransferase PlsY